MPENIFDLSKFKALLPNESPQEKRRRNREREQALAETRSIHEQRRELLRIWGYKPWKRPDRRNRPLRTKRSWVSFRARMREWEIVKLRCKYGLSFRAIGKKIGISHVAAWKRFERAMENIRLEEEYIARCLREISARIKEMDREELAIMNLPPEEQEARFAQLRESRKRQSSIKSKIH